VGQSAPSPPRGHPGIGTAASGNGGYDVVHHGLRLRYATSDPMDPSRPTRRSPPARPHGVEASLQGMEGEDARRQGDLQDRTKAKAVRNAAKKARKEKRASVVTKGLNGMIQEQRNLPAPPFEGQVTAWEVRESPRHRRGVTRARPCRWLPRPRIRPTPAPGTDRGSEAPPPCWERPLTRLPDDPRRLLT
jgi:hypothetical protein